MPGSPPSVEAVRDHLAALRTLEEQARGLLVPSLPPADRATLHAWLGTAWAEVANLEEALAIEGQGEGRERVMVRAQARLRADDAHALAASELFAAATEVGGNLPAPVCAIGLKQGTGLMQSASAREVTRSRGAEVHACWQEHLLTQGAEDPLALLATLELDQGRVTGVSFKPSLDRQRGRLGACLATRLLAWRVTDDAYALELPLRLGSTPAAE